MEFLVEKVAKWAIYPLDGRVMHVTYLVILAFISITCPHNSVNNSS